MKHLLLRQSFPATVLLFVALASSGIRAQDVNHIDSLLKTAMAHPDTVAVDRLLDLADNDETVDLETRIQICIMANDLSKKLDYPKGEIHYGSVYGSLFDTRGMYDSAIVVKRQALDVARRIHDEEWTNRLLVHIAHSHYYMGYLTTTLDCFLQALPYFEKSGTPGALSKIYDNIQLIYHDLGQYDKGIEYGEKSLAIVADHPDSPSRGIILANLSINYKDVSPPRFDDALNALREALQIAKLNGKKSLEAQCHANTGAVCYYMQKYDLAREHYLKAIGLYEKTGKQYALHTSIKGYAQCEKQLGNYREAQKLFEKVLAVAQESELRELESECYDELSYLEVLTGRDMKKNQRYLLKADSVRNLILNDKLALANAELEVKYELSKKEFEISRQQAEIKRQNMIRTFLAAGLSLTILALILLWQALRLRNRRNRTLGELNTALADRNHALDEMNATKDKFFNIISHDLRNPALAQRNALQALLEHSGQWDVATLKEFYRELLDSADSNVELLNNLLNWAQVQTGRIAFKPAATDLSDAFRNEIRLIRRMAEQKGIRFNVEIPPGAVVVADPRMLAVIVRNLLANAVKFTPEGGTVTLSAETAEEQKIEIAVADTGMGMTPEQIKSLFHLDRRPSQPLPSSLRQGAAAGEQGTGLGLIVCSEMLEYHGCILQIESLPDQGSRFRFTLPAQSPRGM